MVFHKDYDRNGTSPHLKKTRGGEMEIDSPLQYREIMLAAQRAGLEPTVGTNAKGQRFLQITDGGRNGIAFVIYFVKADKYGVDFLGAFAATNRKLRVCTWKEAASHVETLFKDNDNFIKMMAGGSD